MTADSLPPTGLGTWQNTDPDQCERTVANALEMGYRHVDTARFYGNEEHVGAGIERADVPREDVFLATKIHPAVEGAAYDEVCEGVEQSRSLLDVDALDLLYVHWPVGNYEASETLAAFDDLHDDGVVAIPKATGEAHLRDNLDAADVELDPEDVERIGGVERRERYVERDGAPWKET